MHELFSGPKFVQAKDPLYYKVHCGSGGEVDCCIAPIFSVKRKHRKLRLCPVITKTLLARLSQSRTYIGTHGMSNTDLISTVINLKYSKALGSAVFGSWKNQCSSKTSVHVIDGTNLAVR